ncbi:hypothetical protein J5N97_016318 [Dioscorea zingiberensis]|uniref:Agenet domain-containing protein n=1 Tax=Dioscorea zingiberensis TaxID=325984 RepID=A0A9D5CJ50_9LILI|nr:hypothetical protein J5N97_016318 [Dioscorea zingiberensis]
MGIDTSGGFEIGDQIEVSCDDEGFHGAWYEATVARCFTGNRRFSVVYNSLLSDTHPSQPLEEVVTASHVRPRPPRSRKRAFDVFQLVEGYHKDGWWPGVVAGIHGKKFLVCFPSTREKVEFPVSMVRPRLRWRKGRWIPAGEEEVDALKEVKFSVGTQVEVTQDKEIFGASWLPGNVVRVVGDTYFLVEYENPKPDDMVCAEGSGRFREIVDLQYMRPSPPDTVYVKEFYIQDEVEVLVSGMWLAGVVAKIKLFGSKYVVRLKYKEVEEEFDLSELRLRCDWNDGQWICVSMHKRRKRAIEGKTKLIDGRLKSGVEGSTPQFPVSGIANEPSEPLSLNIIVACKGKRRSRKKQVSKHSLSPDSVSKLHCGKRKSEEPQLDIVKPKQKAADGSGSEDQCMSPQTQKNSKKEEEQCNSESYLQEKSIASSQLASESPPNPTSEDLLYEQFKGNLYEVNGTHDISTAETGNHVNSNGSNVSHTKRRKKIAVRNSNRLRKSLDLVLREEPAEEERMETSYIPQNKSTIPENASAGCKVDHIEKTADLIVENEQTRKKVERPTHIQSGYLNNEIESGNVDHIEKTADLVVENEQTRKKAEHPTPNQSGFLNNEIESGKVDHIEKTADLVVENEQTRKKVEHPAPNQSGYLNNEIESGCTGNGVTRNEFTTPIGDIIGDLAETYVSPERMIRRMKILDSWTLPKKDQCATPQSKSTRFKPREPMGNVPLCNFNEAIIEVPRKENISIVQQELIPNWLSLNGSTVEKDRASRKLLVDNSTEKEHVLPFEKNSVMWETVESMEIFRILPQQPHFRPLEQYCEEFREGMAIGLMVTFTNLTTDIGKFHISDSEDVFLSRLKALSPLEANGFNVQPLRSRIEQLLEIKSDQSLYEMKRALLENQILEHSNENACYDAAISELDKNISEVEETLARLHKKLATTLKQKETNDSKIVRMQLDLQTTEEAYLLAERDFQAALVALWG